ncbi:helix-turn-helix domain-containing protein [Streptomyces echinatus]|uniref:Transcriptional regulator with XRE-family HTH domain n=1 Tax=Streptomyces echinatus TaxID=67293 RepID=A0A7W9PSI2_9ACTN|nr:helix-turn-helix transcriptional regulator [Streptomyces echinatus]MBB5927160.1 transcriptional regulator with XRE-family HTH domain [Streptomyces echinatus]
MSEGGVTEERRPETPAEVNGAAAVFVVLGKQLKLLREKAGLNQREFGGLVGYGPDQISAMERGVRTPRPEFLQRADEILKADGLFAEVIPQVEEAMSRARTRHPEWYRSYAAMEAEAVELHHYSNHAVQGLLQTEEYARAVFAKRRPFLSEETIEKRVADRLSRQQVFERLPAPVVSYVLEEVVLDRPIGGPRVHAGQLRRLLDVGTMRNVEIQVMPTLLQEHPNMDGAFNLLVPRGYPQVAYTEIQGYPRLITDAEEVRKIADRYGIMRAMALPPLETRALIETKLETL